MTQNPNLAALSAAGVSVWLDDLSRDRLQTGNLQEIIDTKCVVGVTTNPSIFQAALSKGHAYDAQVTELAERGADVEAIQGDGYTPLSRATFYKSAAVMALLKRHGARCQPKETIGSSQAVCVAAAN